MFRRDRSTGQRGGGVAVFVRSGIPATSLVFSSDLEAVCVQLHIPRHGNLFVVTVYRRPDANATNFIDSLESALDRLPIVEKATLCIVGDFNAKNNLWWDGQTSNSAGVQLAELTNSLGLAQIVTGPTRAVGLAHASQIDLMFVNNLTLVNSCDVLSPVSDHCPTIVELSVGVEKSSRPGSSCDPGTKAHKFNYSNVDMATLNAIFRSSDWSPVFNASNTSQALHAWYTVVHSVLDRCVPRSSMAKSSTQKPWYSPFLRRLRRQRDRLFQRSKSLQHDHRLSIAYKRVRNWYVAELRAAERHYYRHLGLSLSTHQLSKQPYRWWSKAKSMCGLKRRDEVPAISVNGKLYASAVEKADCLNDAFSAQCSAPSATDLPNLPDHKGPTFSFTPITNDAIYKHLVSLNTWKAPGIDHVCHRLLKGCAEGLSDSLCYLFNLSLKEGVFPNQWKTAVIQPVYKLKGDRRNPSSYRPIALLPSISKVFEHFVHKQLLDHCLSVQAIPDCQFGFLPKRSTTWQLLEAVNDWEEALDKGHSVHACFVDVAKAFDRVDHNLLLHKLPSIGVLGVELSWFRSYLCGRKICTTVDCVRSRTKPISSGVPQGSVLGPLLFILYFRDLPSVVQATCKMFADDTMVYDTNCSGHRSSPCCKLSSDLHAVSAWASNWNTKFHPLKSSQITFQRNGHHSDHGVLSECIYINGIAVPRTTETKHLGVTITESLKWSMHIRTTIHRLNHRVFILKRLAYRTGSRDLVSIMYKGLVRPILEYAAVVWDACPKSDVIALERLQLSVARTILRLSRRSTSNIDVLRAIGWPTLAWRRRRLKLLCLWRLMHGDGPPALRARLPSSASARTDYSFRNPKFLAFPVCNKSRRLASFLPSTVLLWNSLPPLVISTSSSSAFLRHLDIHFQSDRYSFGLT